MLGTIVNALAIIGGSLLGLLFSKGISKNYEEIILSGVGLSVLLIGIKSALVSDSLMVVIFSVIIGAVLGEWLKIESKLESLGAFLERNVTTKSDDSKSFARGFVTASLVFCVGSMAIVGSLESGLAGNHQTLFAKSILDGVTSVIFASAMGLGVNNHCRYIFKRSAGPGDHRTDDVCGRPAYHSHRLEYAEDNNNSCGQSNPGNLPALLYFALSGVFGIIPG